MAVQKAVDLTGTGASLDDAVSEAVDRASMTLDGVTRFELVAVTGSIGDGGSPTRRTCGSGSRCSNASTAEPWNTGP